MHPGKVKNLGELVNRIDFDPDVVVFGLGWFSHKYFGQIKDIRLPTVCFLFKPQIDLNKKLSFCKINNIQIILTPIPGYSEYETVTGIPTSLFPYAFDPDLFKRREIKNNFDVGFSGALHQNRFYPEGAFPTENIREKIFKALNEDENIKLYWKSSDDVSTALIHDYREYAERINESKMWIATQAAFGDVTPRFFEIAGSGTLLICERLPKSYNYIFKDKINCIMFDSNLVNIRERINYYNFHKEERESLITHAYNEFHKCHTWKNRAEELVSIIEGL